MERVNDLQMEEFISSFVPSNPLLTGFVTITKNSAIRASSTKDEYNLDMYSARTISESDFEACFNLIRETSLSAYESSSIGWSAAKKRKEMRLPDMRYMILHRRHASGNTSSINSEDNGLKSVLGFLSFMVTYEDGKEVIYCYEIHLSSEVQGQGLGKHLITVFEQIGRNVGLEKAMMTVFMSNVRAIQFYDRLGYVLDEYSPAPRRLRNGSIKEPDYRILSKKL